MNNAKKSLLFLISLSFLILPAVLMADNIDAVDKYSWSENLGWMNWKPSYGGTDYGVTVYKQCLTGYIWAENAGWIKLGNTSCADNNCCQMGITEGYENDSNSLDDDGDGVVDDWGVNHDGLGNLSGYAWGENTGWISFSSPYHQVTIDPNNGEFMGYAWAENAGWINMNCANDASCGIVNFKVKTSFDFLDILPPTNASVLINGGSSQTSSSQVVLTIYAEDGASGMGWMKVSEDPSFIGTVWETYQTTKNWTLSSGSGEKIIYVVFKDGVGNASPAYWDSIFFSTIGLGGGGTGVTPSPPSSLPDDSDQEQDSGFGGLGLSGQEAMIASLKAQIAQIQQQIIALLIRLIALLQQQINLVS